MVYCLCLVSGSPGSSSNFNFSDDEDYQSIPFVFMPYQFEPLARPDREVQTSSSETDEDGLSQAEVDARYEGEKAPRSVVSCASSGALTLYHITRNTHCIIAIPANGQLFYNVLDRISTNRC